MVTRQGSPPDVRDQLEISRSVSSFMQDGSILNSLHASETRVAHCNVRVIVPRISTNLWFL